MAAPSPLPLTPTTAPRSPALTSTPTRGTPSPPASPPPPARVASAHPRPAHAHPRPLPLPQSQTRAVPGRAPAAVGSSPRGRAPSRCRGETPSTKEGEQQKAGHTHTRTAAPSACGETPASPPEPRQRGREAAEKRRLSARAAATMGCCTGRCTLIFLCSLQLVSARPSAPGHASASRGVGRDGRSPPAPRARSCPRRVRVRAASPAPDGPSPPHPRPVSFAVGGEEDAAWARAAPWPGRGKAADRGGGRGASTRAAVSAPGLRERHSPASASLGGVLAPRWGRAEASPGCCKRTMRRKGRTPPPPGRHPLPWGGSGPGGAGRCRRGPPVSARWGRVREGNRRRRLSPFSVLLNLCESGTCRPSAVTFPEVPFLRLNIRQRAIVPTERCIIFSLFAEVGVFVSEKRVIDTKHCQTIIILPLWLISWMIK